MKIFLTLVLMISLLACESDHSFEPQSKPSGIPESAFWVGGYDGGVYIKIDEKDGAKNKYYASIYFDATGEIWYEGLLTYSGSKALDIKDKRIYSFWDGEDLYLVGGGALTSEVK